MESQCHRRLRQRHRPKLPSLSSNRVATVTADTLGEAARRLAISVEDAQQSAITALAERRPVQHGGASSSGGVGPSSSAVASQCTFDLTAADGSASQLSLIQRRILHDQGETLKADWENEHIRISAYVSSMQNASPTSPTRSSRYSRRRDR